MSQNSRTFLKSVYGFDAVVRRVDDGDWENPSPCEGWTATDVVAHNIAMCEMIAGFAAGVGAKHPTQSTPDDPGGAWDASFTTLTEALDSQGALQTVNVTPWGEMAVEKFLGFVWVDPLVHTWDLAMATGQPAKLDPPLVERGYKQLQRAGDSLRGEGRFGAAVEESDDMSALD
ncbi:MAG: TIGR03086 family metal-binding protein, partial [Acidimicrobiales bacterium]